MKKKIIYVTPVDFKKESAARTRIVNNVKAIESDLFDVLVLDGSKNDTEENINFLIDGVSVVSPSSKSISKAPSNKLYNYFVLISRSLKFLKTSEETVDSIILYSGYTPYLISLLVFCRKNGVKLYFDAVEWYVPKSALEYLYKPYYWNTGFSMRFLVPLCDGVISISSFLSKFYQQKGLKTVLVPPLFDIKKYRLAQSVIDAQRPYPIRLVYAGNPGHKDLIEDVVSVVREFKGEFHLSIVGVAGKSEPNIKYFGWLDNARAQSIVKQSHFTVLLRPDNRKSHAGFSTKIVESMSLGTPVISNNTSDISNYITDRLNGYIFDGYSGFELAEKLKVVQSEFEIERYSNMKNNCILSAMDNFSTESKQLELIEFLS
jgi:glycosyltransferase involved in cell wall biosynthesis